MKHFLLSCFVFSFCLGFGQQSLRDFIQNNACHINSIQVNDTAFNDLECVGNAIADARVVMLGEMYHGDGAAFEAKTRLINYLHTKKQFNVLVFESNFIGLTKGQYQLDSQKNIAGFDSLITGNVFGIWTQAKQCQPLFEYLMHSSLKVSGMDSQLGGKAEDYSLKPALKNYIESTKVPYIKSRYYNTQFWNDFDSCLKLFTHFSFENKMAYNIETLLHLQTAIDSILFQMQNQDSHFLHQTLKSFGANCKMYVHLKDFNLANSIRDEQMADNLKWLATYLYPNQKIIVWAANSHIIKNNHQEFKNYRPTDPYTLGYYFNKYNIKSYSLCFTSHNGLGIVQTQNPYRYKIVKSKKNSLENYCLALNKDYLFVPIAAYKNEENSFFISKLDGNYNLKARWNKITDGIFYIKTMTPAERK